MGRALLLAMFVSSGCANACPAWDAHGEGPCNLVLGVAWDGRSCVPVSGCSCVGRDCDLLVGDDDSLCREAACTPRAGRDAAR